MMGSHTDELTAAIEVRYEEQARATIALQREITHMFTNSGA